MVSKDVAGYESRTIDDQHCSVCTMFVASNECTLVRGEIAPGGWCKFFKRAARPLGKANAMDSDFTTFLSIVKIDEDRRLVSGYASTEAKDSDGEIIDLKAIKAALPDYLEYGNVREMHKLNAVGVAAETNLDSKGLYLTAHISDDAAWKKCIPTKMADGTILPPVYKGFSIGGRKLDKKGNRITALELTEISVVDRPSNPECRIDIAKSAKPEPNTGGHLIKVKKEKTPEQRALRKMAKAVSALTKAGPPAAHDGFSLPAKISSEKPDGVQSVNDSRPAENVTRKGDGDMMCEKHGKANCALCAVEKAQEVDAKQKPSKEEPKVKEKKAKKIAKRFAEDRLFDLKGEGFLTLRKVQDLDAALADEDEGSASLAKGMSGAGSLAYCFDSIRDIQRRLMVEAKREGGDGKDKDLAKALGAIAKQLATVIGQKATHEGEEALTMTDADDQYLSSLLGEGYGKMYKTAADASDDNGDDGLVLEKTGDPLTDAVQALLKRAAAPSRAARMKSATENVQKARKAAKEARKAVEEAHGMHKAAYIAKAAKKNKDNDDDEFDHAGAMEKLQKAYQEIDKARTFGKAAEAQLEKLARSGQRGEETADADAGFYQVPPGVTDLTPNAMSGAAPGTKGGNGVPPAYPTDGSVYAGKAIPGGDLAKYAKNGMMPAAMVELLVKQAQMEGELEALRRLPAAALSGRQRPFSFDMTKTVGAAGEAGKVDLNKALFDGVNVGAIGSQDERAHVEATAKVIGNLLTSGHFGKSIIDPSFRGAAGTH